MGRVQFCRSLKKNWIYRNQLDKSFPKQHAWNKWNHHVFWETFIFLLTRIEILFEFYSEFFWKRHHTYCIWISLSRHGGWYACLFGDAKNEHPSWLLSSTRAELSNTPNKCRILSLAPFYIIYNNQGPNFEHLGSLLYKYSSNEAPLVLRWLLHFL